MQKGVLQFSLCNNSSKAVKAGLISPKLPMRTLRLRETTKLIWDPEQLPFTPALLSSSVADEASWQRESGRLGNKRCPPRQQLLCWEKKQASYTEKFRVVLGRFLWNKICIIDSVANENLTWTL